MSLYIENDCTACNLCLPECPNEAISEGDDLYTIDSKKCTECVGFFDVPQCVDICPIECILPDPKYVESESDLLNQVRALHPDIEFADDAPSHFGNPEYSL